MNGDFPVITLEARALGKVLTAAFIAHADQISKEVEAGVARAVENFDFEAEIKKKADNAIRVAIERNIEQFFTWGEGSEVIKAAMAKTLSRSTTGEKP